MEETSIKEMIQNMAQSVAGIDLLQGTVTQASPLKIQVAGDDKLIITETNTIVPRSLTDYTVTADISGGSVSGATGSAGSHGHAVSATLESAGAHAHKYGGETEEGGDAGQEHSHGYSGTTEEAGEHAHEVSAEAGSSGEHTHGIASFAVTGATVTVHNALAAGDVVHLLQFRSGKQYYVLDRVKG